MNKVYVIMETERVSRSGKHEKIYNLKPAEKFGEIVVPAIFPRKIYDVPNDWLIDQAKKSLDKFSENDYILLIGDPVAIGIVTAVVAQKQDRLKLLRWNPRDQDYAVIDLLLNKRNNGDGDNRSLGTRREDVRRHFRKQ